MEKLFASFFVSLFAYQLKAEHKMTDDKRASTPADIDELLAVAHAESRALIEAQSQTNKRYEAEWKSFTNWVKSSPAINKQSDGKFLTRINVDLYFQQVVRFRKGTKNTVRTAVSALQWFADYREHVGANPRFLVESPMVKSAIEMQQTVRRVTGGHGNPGADPCKGLKDIFPAKDKERIMDHIYRHRKDWAAAAMNFTWGHNGAVRGDSNRKLTYSDVNMSYGFGPEEEGPLARCLLLVLRKGVKNKDRHDSDKQVGCWRHKSYKQCSVFATAVTIIHYLSTSDVKFEHRNKGERAPWWEIPLIDWSEYSGTNVIFAILFRCSASALTTLLVSYFC